jgi:undecaprenyl-diphosphatase
MRPLRDFRLPGDEAIYHVLNGLDSRGVDAVSRLLSNRSFEIGLAVLLFLYVLVRHRRRAVATFILTVTAIAVNDRFGAAVLKPTFARERPCYALPPGEFHQGEPVAHSGSLPSSHASNAFAGALPLSLGAPELSAVVYGIASLIALSRVQLGVHWPSDIAVGAIVGSLTAGGLVALYRFLAHRARGLEYTRVISVTATCMRLPAPLPRSDD